MPNTGKPSLACHTCRAKRVKCDLTRPGCLKCKGNCPGYRDQEDLKFHNKDLASYTKSLGSTQAKGSESRSSSVARNSNALELPTRGFTQRSFSFSSRPQNLSEPANHNAGEDNDTSRLHSLQEVDSKDPQTALSTISSSATLTRRNHLPLSPELAEKWETHAFPLVLDHLSIPVNGGRFLGYLGFLPGLFRETGEDSCLHLTTNAVFLTYMARRNPGSFNIRVAAKAYGKALHSVNASLQERSTYLQNGTIMAVWLLGVNEFMQGSPIRTEKPGPCAWHAHMNGLTTLLRLRGNSQFSTREGRSLFWMTYTSVQTGCLATNIPCPRETAGWLDILRRDLDNFEENFVAVVDYNAKVSSICWRIQKAIARDDTEDLAFTFPTLLREADDIENDVLKWKHLLDKRPPTGPYETQQRIYIWNMYRLTRCKLQHLLIKLLDHVEYLPTPIPNLPPLEPRRKNCVLTLRTTFQEILETAPAALDEPDSEAIDRALTMSRPLHWADVFHIFGCLKVVWWSELALPRQRHLAYMGLQRLVDELGNRHVMVIPPFQEMSTEAWFSTCTRENCLLHNRSTSEVLG